MGIQYKCKGSFDEDLNSICGSAGSCMAIIVNDTIPTSCLYDEEVVEWVKVVALT